MERSCGPDTELRNEVLRLLRAHQLSAGILDTPALQFGTPLLRHTDLPDDVIVSMPERVGQFRVVRVLGRGGMGEVYLAERDDGQFQQRVALKLIRHGSPDLVRRFVEERRILALLEHPGIARLVDGGITAFGQPYFAMELVEGEPIDQYCKTRELSLERRLELFGAVCDAVAYAHQHLVIHRDLKPSNILVTADAQVKLLDFGIAKLLDDTEEGVDRTRTGMYVMTPEFAAPEQVRGETVSTATDVYSLGVLLYILLTGERPYDVRGKSPAEVQRVICDEEPIRPSSKAPEPLRRRLRGDLDVIVLKALHKDRARRYQTPAELKLELTRFLSGHPVAARPDSARYRARKFIRRHRLGLSATLAIVALLSAYATTILRDRQRIRRALAEAQAGTRKAEQVTDFMLGLFQAAEGGRALTDTITAREMLGRGLVQARELGAQPELQAQMFDVIGRLNMQLGDFGAAQPLFTQALQMRRTLYGDLHPDVATSMSNLAQATERQENFAQAIELRRNALALRRRLAHADDPKSMDALHALASALHSAGNATESRQLFEEWLTRLSKRSGEMTAWHADQLTGAALYLNLRGEASRAEPMLRQALAIRRALFGQRHHLVAESLQDLLQLLDRTERREEAELLARESVEILRATYPDGHPELGRALKMHGVVLEHLRRFADAEPLLRESLALRRRFAGPNSVDVATAELDLAITQIMTGRYQEAESISRDAIRILQAKFGANNAMVFYAKIHLGDALRGQGRLREAEPLLLAGYRKFETPTPVTGQWRRYALSALVRLREAQARPDEAAKYRDLLAASPPSPARR